MDLIIQSLLDTDLYKFTMLQAVLHKHPEAEGTYEFKCRNATEAPLAVIAEEVKRQVDALCTLKFQPAELDYLRSLRFIKPSFVDFLEDFRLKQRHVSIGANAAGGLDIRVKGPLVHVMLFEIYLLAIVNEVYFRRFDGAPLLAEGRRRLDAKIALLRDAANDMGERRFPFEFFDFGTRRRYARDWQREVVSRCAEEVPQFFKGTSNVRLAMDLGLSPIGTMAHEYLQLHQALGYRLRDFQKMALENWVQEYRGDLGIALTDVVGMDAFLADFDLYFAKLFDGLRHDSGDPLQWAEKAIAHYRKLGIDPATKRLVFSDGLTLPTALDLYARFSDVTRLGFGIGTHLSNDMGVPALNIVIKLVEANGQPVAKLSDSPGKTMCRDQAFLTYLAQVFGVKYFAEQS